MPLTHFDETGASRMVDTSAKAETVRTAVAAGEVTMKPETWEQLRSKTLSKGDVLEVARLAGIMAAKKTGELIPLCHPLPITAVKIDFQLPVIGKVEIQAEVKVTGRTGVEMEALTAVSITALTIYDMCKSIDKEMAIGNIRLLSKTGGKSGDYVRPKP